jgi:hypothetical protein
MRGFVGNILEREFGPPGGDVYGNISERIFDPP